MHFGRGWLNIAQHWEDCEKSLLEIGNAQMQKVLSTKTKCQHDWLILKWNPDTGICLRFVIGNEKAIASAGNRTRINCLEGSYANHYTTDAFYRPFSCQYKQVFSVYSNQIGNEKAIASGWKSDFDNNHERVRTGLLSTKLYDLENPGIDPGTSRMQSERSTIWANPP